MFKTLGRGNKKDKSDKAPANASAGPIGPVHGTTSHLSRNIDSKEH